MTCLLGLREHARSTASVVVCRKRAWRMTSSPDSARIPCSLSTCSGQSIFKRVANGHERAPQTMLNSDFLTTRFAWGKGSTRWPSVCDTWASRSFGRMSPHQAHSSASCRRTTALTWLRRQRVMCLARSTADQLNKPVSPRIKTHGYRARKLTHCRRTLASCGERS